MNRSTRELALIFVVPATFYVVFCLSVLFAPHQLSLVAGAIAAAMAGWYVWRQTDSPDRSVVTAALLGAIFLGAIGFLAGFAGPVLIAPDANQGPLLGIFITGPAGIAFGAVAGALYGRYRRRRADSAMRSAATP